MGSGAGSILILSSAQEFLSTFVVIFIYKLSVGPWQNVH